MTLDLAVAVAVGQARLLERALHATGVWSIEVGDSQFHAEREVLDDQIVFRTFIPGGITGDSLTLILDGDFMSARPFECVCDGELEVCWVLRVDVPASV